MPQVLNMRKLSRGQISDMIASGKAARCDRQTRFGNPHYMRSEAERNFVCDEFEIHDLPKLDVTGLRGKDLLCWCAPKRCHCDSILRKANA